MFAVCPGNAERAESVKKLLGVDVFAAIDGSSALFAVVEGTEVNSFVNQCVERLTAFQVAERRSLQDAGKPSRVYVQFFCGDYAWMLDCLMSEGG